MATAQNTPDITQYKGYLLFSLLVVVVAVYLLAPILMPFFISALLAYLGDPLVDKLERYRLSRSVAVSLVYSVIIIANLLLLLVLLPLLSQQVSTLLTRLPQYLALIQSHMIPFLSNIGLPIETVQVGNIQQVLLEYWQNVGQVAGSIVAYVTSSGLLLLQWMANIILIPVLTFYLLRDWDDIVMKLRKLFPRRSVESWTALSIECDTVLAAFFRGQLMVMLVLSLIYISGLTLIGIELALLLGVVAGIVSFVPYLGFIIGVTLSGLAAYFQFYTVGPVLLVFALFIVAQLIEGMVLTPRFVGERIGLHPVAVLFAVMAGAQLFGFLGVLLALPVAAIMMVLLRHGYQRYLNSELYQAR